MEALSRYFAEKSLRKIAAKLQAHQQASVDILLSLLCDDGRVNYNRLRDTLSPLAGSTNSANTMLTRFLDRINDAAKASGMVFNAVTTANKKAGEDRWVWFEGLAEATAKAYMGDLNGIPEAARMEDQRGLPLGRPVVLMTFNEHETRAVLSIFGAGTTPQTSGATHPFFRLGLHGGQEVILVISGQRRGPAQQAATWAIDHFHPSAVIGVGIAFGVHNGKRALGDVLVSDCLFDYENARLNGDGRKTFRGPRPPASRPLVNRLVALDHQNGERLDWPKLWIGLLACGDKLVDNPDFIAELTLEAPEVIGGDMESMGIEVATSTSKVDWIVIKGVSDWGDGKKNTANKDEHQKASARNAAKVAKALLDTGALAPQPNKEALPPPAQPPLARQDCLPPSAHIMGLRDLREVPGANVDNCARGLPARLDDKSPPLEANVSQEDPSQAVLPYLRQWLNDPAAPPLFALLGEYGMGKTITCQLLAKQLDDERQADPTLPIPLYFDLRHITGLRERVPKLHEAVEECMSRGWLDDGQGQEYVLANVHRWVKQGAVVIFDGLDEVLVKLTEADGKVFTDNILKLIADSKASAKAEGRGLRLKVLITCRTQYFPTLQAQKSHFTQSQRGEFNAELYRAMVLLPWGEEQVRRYLGQALPEMDLNKLLDMVRSIHNLEELTQRPYTLKLVAEFIPDIESDRAAGRVVYGVTLYRKMAEKWLTRDSGKHHIRPEHKLRLAAHLAAHLWRTKRNALPAEDLNSWFHEWLETEADLRRRYTNLHPDQLEEDLRTATFLARNDEGEASSFRFAHTSLMEFFLARFLMNAVEINAPAAWAMTVPSRETLDFLGQLLGETDNQNLLQTLQAWRMTYVPQISELLLAYALRAQESGWPMPTLRNIDLRGASLRSWVVKGREEAPLDMEGAHFEGADLRDCTFRFVTMHQAGFVGTNLSRANILDCSVSGADFRNTELTSAIFRRCRLEKVEWMGAKGYRTQWLDCMPLGEPWRGGTEPTLTRPLFAPESEVQANEALVWLAGHQSLIFSCAFAPGPDASSRQWLASTGGDGTVRLWDVGSGEEGPLLGSHTDCAWSCAFAPRLDGSGRLWLASGGEDGTVRLWNAGTAEEGPSLHGHDGTVYACAFASAPDGSGRQWLASGGEDGTVRLWDVESGGAGPVLRGHEGVVYACAFAPEPDGSGRQWLASAGEDGTVRLWDAESGRAGPVLRGHEGVVYTCAFAPALDGSGRQWLASGGEDTTVRLWDVESGGAGPVLRGHEDSVYACAFAPDLDSSGQRWLASAGGHGMVRLWNTESGEARLVLKSHEDWVRTCAFAPALDNSGRLWLASGGDDRSVRLWDGLSGDAGPVLKNRQQSVDSCSLSPRVGGKSWLASAEHDGTVRIWNAESGTAELMLKGHKGRVWFCSFASGLDASNRLWLATAGGDSTVRLWDAESGKAGPVLRGHEGTVFACAFAPDLDGSGRRWLASAGEDGTVRLWDTESGVAELLLKGHKGSVRTCAFAPALDKSGRLWLASGGSDGMVRLWNAITGEPGLALKGHEGQVLSCTFAPVPDAAGRHWLVSAGDDGKVRLWDVDSGEAGLTLSGHAGWVWSCAFAPAPDGAGRWWMATAGSDHTVRLWDVWSGEAGLVMTGHEYQVTSCTIASGPSGSLWLTSSGYDGTLRLWDVETGECIRITATCDTNLVSNGGYAVWEPRANRVIEVTGDAWRHLAWMRPLPHALPERLPLETFGPVPWAKIG